MDSQKRAIQENNLGEAEKKKLCGLWDETWKNAESKIYEKREQGNASIGMLGTGFSLLRERPVRKVSRPLSKCA